MESGMRPAAACACGRTDSRTKLQSLFLERKLCGELLMLSDKEGRGDGQSLSHQGVHVRGQERWQAHAPHAQLLHEHQRLAGVRRLDKHVAQHLQPAAHAPSPRLRRPACASLRR